MVGGLACALRRWSARTRLFRWHRPCVLLQNSPERFLSPPVSPVAHCCCNVRCLAEVIVHRLRYGYRHLFSAGRFATRYAFFDIA